MELKRSQLAEDDLPDILGIVICRLLLPSPPSPKGLIWMMYSSSRGSESSTDVVLVSIMLGLLNWFRLYSIYKTITISFQTIISIYIVPLVIRMIWDFQWLMHEDSISVLLAISLNHSV